MNENNVILNVSKNSIYIYSYIVIYLLLLLLLLLLFYTEVKYTLTSYHGTFP